jgi:hypothetical protein
VSLLCLLLANWHPMWLAAAAYTVAVEVAGYLLYGLYSLFVPKICTYKLPVKEKKVEFWNRLSGPIHFGPIRDSGLDGTGPCPNLCPSRALPRSGSTVGWSSLHPKPDRVDPSRANPWTWSDRPVDRGPDRDLDHFFIIFEYYSIFK